MTDDPDNVTDLNRERFNRIDAKLDRLLASAETLNHRQSSIEERMTSLERNQAHGFAQLHTRVDVVQQQLDKVDQRLSRIEKRLDLVDAG